MSAPETSAGEFDGGGRHDIVYPSTIAFVGAHIGCLAVIWSGVTWRAILICLTLYWVRIFAIGAGYHRYFSHRAYSTTRLFQFILAFLSQSSAQKSVLWWAAKHRQHHRYSDTDQDVHSPQRDGFLYSHIGWVFDRKHRTADLTQIQDFARYPELMWLHRFETGPAILAGVICFLLAGWSGLVVGFLWSTVLVYHATFCINSLAHVRGRKRYVTGDESRNNGFLALFTLGEGWHNNHHACQSSVRQGFKWWEVDPTYYVLWSLSKLGVVWGLKTPSADLLRGEHRLGSRVIERAAQQLAARFSVQGTPSREALLAMAAGMFFAGTVSLEEIVSRAQALLVSPAGSLEGARQYALPQSARPLARPLASPPAGESGAAPF